jgi:YggT family protein
MPQFMVGQIIGFIAWMLDSLLSLYWWILIIAVLLTWVNPDPRNPIVSFLRSATEPVLYQVRRRLPFVYAGGFDFSPIVVLLAIAFVQRVVVSSLYELAVRVRMALAAGAVIG